MNLLIFFSLYILWIGSGIIPLLLYERKLIQILSYGVRNEIIGIEDAQYMEDKWSPKFIYIATLMLGPISLPVFLDSIDQTHFSIYIRHRNGKHQQYSKSISNLEQLNLHIGYISETSRYKKILDESQKLRESEKKIQELEELLTKEGIQKLE